MKILVLSSHTQSLFWFRIGMMKAFIKEGHEVVAVGNLPESEWREKFAESGMEYRSIHVERNGINPLHDLKTLGLISDLIKEISPDKIFAYQAKSIIYGSLAASKNGIDEVYSLVAGLGSVFNGSSFKLRVVRRIMIYGYKAALKRNKKVIFQNNDDLGCFLKNKIVKSEKTEIVHGSGVDTNRFTPSEFPENPTFLMVSRLIKDKGVLEYLDACRIIKKKYPHVRCLLVGPYDTNPSAITEEKINLYTEDGSVEYLGETDDVRPFLKECSTFVLPSHHEGLPKSALEAMACGRPVITTDAPGCRECVSHGEDGVLVPVGDVNALCEAMEYFLSHEEEVKKMGERARTAAVTKYDLEIVNSRIMDIMGLKKANN